MIKTEENKWDLRFLELAKFISGWSKDISTKVGAVITEGKRIVSVGYNGFATGVDDSLERYTNRDFKIATVVHAEVNAVLFAKRDLKGCTLDTYPMMTCSRCASIVIQTGISRCVASRPSLDREERWGKEFAIAKQLFCEAKVKLNILDLT